MQALKEDTEHFQRVMGVIEAAAEMSCRSPKFGELIRTGFGVKKIACSGSLIQTVYPAKGDLLFQIGGTMYTISVAILPDEKFAPVKKAD